MLNRPRLLRGRRMSPAGLSHGARQAANGSTDEGPHHRRSFYESENAVAELTNRDVIQDWSSASPEVVAGFVRKEM